MNRQVLFMRHVLAVVMGIFVLAESQIWCGLKHGMTKSLVYSRPSDTHLCCFMANYA